MTNARRPGRGRGVLLGALVTAATVTWPPSATGASMQVAHSDEGLFARADTYDIPFADGSTRVLSVTLAVPQGATTATPATGSVDLARPWVVVTETISTDPASGHTRNGREVCNSVSNPDGWSAGSLAPDGVTWVGASVDVGCDDGNGYLFYRLHWEPGPFWLVTNQVTTTVMGGQVTAWSTDTMQGTVELHPRANQQAVVSVCGYREATGFDCFDRRRGHGAVVPFTDGMVSQAVSVRGLTSGLTR